MRTITEASLPDLQQRVHLAVDAFWRMRAFQRQQQGASSGRRDAGNRAAATGGQQLAGFNDLVAELLVEAGVPTQCIHRGARGDVTLPGHFRPTKQWDLLVIANGKLLAAFETKALCGPSFGNNYNNRVEEALGSSQDIWTAYREGAFRDSPEPFVGYLLLLEEHIASSRPVGVAQAHFPVFDDFVDASYIGRCEHSLRRLVRERCYHAACLLVSPNPHGAAATYREPASDIAFDRFASLSCGHVRANYDALGLG